MLTIFELNGNFFYEQIYMSEGLEEKNNNQDQVQQQQSQPQSQSQTQQIQQQTQQQQQQSQQPQQNPQQSQQTPQQPQQIPQQTINAPAPSQAECMAFVKFARYTALAADRLAGALLQMTARLEDEGILKCGRSSRLERDKKLRLYAMNIHKSDSDINDMMKLIPNHPDAEKLINSLFRGVRNIVSNAENLNKLPDENLMEGIPDANLMENNIINNNDDNETNNTSDHNQQQEISDIINNQQETEIQQQSVHDMSNAEVLEAAANPISDLTNSNSKD